MKPTTNLAELLRRAASLALLMRAATAAGSPTASVHQAALVGLLRRALLMAEATPRTTERTKP